MQSSVKTHGGGRSSSGLNSFRSAEEILGMEVSQAASRHQSCGEVCFSLGSYIEDVTGEPDAKTGKEHAGLTCSTPGNPDVLEAVL